MLKSDLNLISIAERSDDWIDVSELENKATSKEAKEILHSIAYRMYLQEEYYSYGEN